MSSSYLLDEPYIHTRIVPVETEGSLLSSLSRFSLLYGAVFAVAHAPANMVVHMVLEHNVMAGGADCGRHLSGIPLESGESDRI